MLTRIDAVPTKFDGIDDDLSDQLIRFLSNEVDIINYDLSIIEKAIAINSTSPMTAASLNGMYAAPFQVLPAPQPGTVNIVDKVYLVQKYGSAPFAGGGAIQLQYGNAAAGAGPAASSSLAAAVLNAATTSTLYELNGVASVDLSTATAEAIYLSNATGAFTTGDSTFSVMVYYRNIAV